MKLTYLGHSAFLVENGLSRIVIDPFLTGNPTAAVSADAIRADAVLLTHGHADHVADAESIARANDAIIVAPMEIADYYARKGLRTHAMHLGGSYTFPFGRVKLTLAFHGSGFETPEGIINGGSPCGYLLTMGGKTFYHAGDTALFGDMQWIGKLHSVDVAALPIGDNFTMGPEDAALAAEWISAKLVIPMHYNTFDVIRQSPEAFASAIAAKGLRAAVLQPGEELTV